jgi:serine/threonine-protein kinase RsbT
MASIAVSPVRVRLQTRADVEHARRAARELATAIGMGRADAESVALAVSELASNVIRYAGTGEVVLRSLEGARRGVEIECCDAGPGIPNVDKAMQDGFSTGGGLGSGLPGARRLMDEFEISSTTEGTTVRARKWLTDQS